MRYLILIVLLLSGCGEPMSAEQMAAKIEECKKVGLGYRVSRVGMSGSGLVSDIHCEPSDAFFTGGYNSPDVPQQKGSDDGKI